METIQYALRLAPESAQLAFEAAVVFATVDDRTSALLYARKALEGGVDRRWFDFPWFDALAITAGGVMVKISCDWFEIR